MPPPDSPEFYPKRPGAQLRRWVLLASGLVLIAVLIKALGRSSVPGDSLWLVFRWPLLAVGAVGAPLVVWRLLRWRARRTTNPSQPLQS